MQMGMHLIPGFPYISLFEPQFPLQQDGNNSASSQWC